MLSLRGCRHSLPSSRTISYEQSSKSTAGTIGWTGGFADCRTDTSHLAVFFASTPLSVKSSYLSHLPYHFLRFIQSKAQFYFFRPILNKKSTNNQLAIQKYSNQSDEILRNIAFTLQSLFFPSISFSLPRNSLITQHLRSGFPTVFIFVFPLLFLRSLITLFSNVFSLHVCFLVY